MKKVIFISALAIAAAASCTKSDIVDTKFNEEISFQTYLGRDAETKAVVTSNANLQSVKVFGYYGGNQEWSNQSALWTNGITLTKTDTGISQPEGDNQRYWANDSDYYTFLAYVPATGVEEATTEAGTPAIKYTVDDNFGSDVLVAVPQIDRTKKTVDEQPVTEGRVDLVLQHKLSRFTIKTDVTEGGAFEIRIKNISLSGNFYPTATIALDAPNAWTGNTAETTYTFHDAADVDAARPTGVADLAASTADGNGKGYLMMIPVTADVHKAELYVEYTTYDPIAKQESRVYDATYAIDKNFVMGKAYAVTLQFSTAADLIKFTVDVEDWVNEAGEDADPNNETPVVPTPVTEEDDQTDEPVQD